MSQVITTTLVPRRSIESLYRPANSGDALADALIEVAGCTINRGNQILAMWDGDADDLTYRGGRTYGCMLHQILFEPHTLLQDVHDFFKQVALPAMYGFINNSDRIIYLIGVDGRKLAVLPGTHTRNLGRVNRFDPNTKQNIGKWNGRVRGVEIQDAPMDNTRLMDIVRRVGDREIDCNCTDDIGFHDIGEIFRLTIDVRNPHMNSRDIARLYAVMNIDPNLVEILGRETSITGRIYDGFWGASYQQDFDIENIDHRRAVINKYCTLEKLKTHGSLCNILWRSPPNAFPQETLFPFMSALCRGAGLEEKDLCGEYCRRRGDDCIGEKLAYCTGNNIYNTSTLCPVFCDRENPTTDKPMCQDAKQDYCFNTVTGKGLADPQCKLWCSQKDFAGLCVSAVSDFCRDNPDDIFCGCTNSTMPNQRACLDPQCQSGRIKGNLPTDNPNAAVYWNPQDYVDAQNCPKCVQQVYNDGSYSMIDNIVMQMTCGEDGVAKNTQVQDPTKSTLAKYNAMWVDLINGGILLPAAPKNAVDRLKIILADSTVSANLMASSILPNSWTDLFNAAAAFYKNSATEAPEIATERFLNLLPLSPHINALTTAATSESPILVSGSSSLTGAASVLVNNIRVILSNAEVYCARREGADIPAIPTPYKPPPVSPTDSTPTSASSTLSDNKKILIMLMVLLILVVTLLTGVYFYRKRRRNKVPTV